ncbi:polysaccharide lyase family 7 protein [Microvirga arabica]|uniref:polysaccharide lyase family 7 protein n=1 Tax=Microvirga arabica TaxID=1128671 RepID=UPI00193A8943|nr:polysaccharide lyase family 7 protein [Microvirga arabica]MBM1172057.1 polysaccharide lyase family 7 protein [Microvirga arabica]
MVLATNVAPSGNFDLSNWKLTLPVDSSGGTSGTAVEVKNLIDYQHSRYFYTGSDGAMTFMASADGATTSGSSYARSELREMKGTEKAAWNLTQGGIMTATLEVDAAPNREGVGGKIVVGQIHGQDKELVRLYWENGKMYFANDQAGSGNSETKFYFVDSSGQQPSVSLDEKFSYTIDAKGSDLEVTIYADGQIYKSVTKINNVWQSDTFYFKAGAYLGANETNGSGYGQTSFYDLRFNHTDSPLTPNDTPLAPVEQPSAPSEPAITPTAPIPAPVAGKIGAGTTQAEAMTLDKFTIFSASTATGGQGIESRTKDVKATAKATFDGDGGTYKLKVDYYDENDGAAQFGILVNGVVVKAWVADKSLGSAVADAKTLTSQEIQLTLNKGDTIELYGIRKDNDMARLDDITLTKVAVEETAAVETNLTDTSSTQPADNTTSTGSVTTDTVRPVTTKTIEGSNSNNYVTGTSGNDWLKGNAGRDVLWGKLGSDVLTGGTEQDAFVFDTAIGKDVDYITDFNVPDDSIRLENSIFTKLGSTGTLSASSFVVGEKALDSNDYIVYNANTGALSYDADGSGAAAAVLFAVIENKAVLTAADFIVI